MNFYDLHLHSVFSGGESSLEELASMAKQLGYKGICFAAYYQDKRQMGILQVEIERVKKQVGIEVFLGFEARNTRELDFLTKKRREFDILLARGGNLTFNREACEIPEVDVLTHPEFGRNDSGLDHVCANFAAKNNVAIEMNFREILVSTNKTRGKILSNIEHNIKLAKRCHAPIIICSGAISHWELKSPEVMISMACQLGLELKEAKDAITKVPENIIKLIKERRSESWIRPGVKVIE